MRALPFLFRFRGRRPRPRERRELQVREDEQLAPRKEVKVGSLATRIVSGRSCFAAVKNENEAKCEEK